MKTLVAPKALFDGSVASRRPSARLLGIAPVALLLTGLLAISAGPLAAPAAAAAPTSPIIGWGYNDDGQASPPTGLSGVTAIAAGTCHSVALKTDGTVLAWGNNEYGQTGVPPGLTGVTAIAAGPYGSFAVRSDGTVVAWGDVYPVPAGLSGVTAISAGTFHSLALRSDGTVVAWGNNSTHQTDVPGGLSGVAAIAAGGYHSLALKSDGTVVAWGSDSSGQSTVPAGLSGVTSIAAGQYHSLALKSDGSVVGWGRATEGQIAVPADLSGVTAIAAGLKRSLALRSDGTVAAWGDDSIGQSTVPAGLSGVTAIASGQLHSLALTAPVPPPAAWGQNSNGQSTVPTGLTGAKGLAGGMYHSLALKADGTVAAWGRNTHSQTTVPAGLSGVAAIAAGGYHSLALKADGTVAAWGLNDDHQADVPTDLTGVTAIAAGMCHSLALKADGTVVAWGLNSTHQTDVPGGLSGVTAIAAGGYHSLALKSDGTVVAWGSSLYGQATVPGGLSGVTAISAGYFHSLALKSDGTVVAWGDHEYDQISVPVGLTGVTAIAAGSYHNVALYADGTLAAWGWNDDGQSEVPAAVSGVTAISAGGYHNLVLEPSAPTALTVTDLASPRIAGAAGNVTVTATDAYGNTATGYTGTVHITSSDAAAVLPPDGALSAGVRTFSVTLNTAGPQSLSATDTVDSYVTGTATLQVNVGTLHHLVLSPASATITAGGSQAYTAIGYDSHNNSLGDLTSATNFTISGGGSCTLASCTSIVPGDHTVTGTDGSATGTATLHVNPVGGITGATYHALTPARILDSRDGTGGLSGPFGSHVARTFGVTGHGGVPVGATAVTGNLTVTGQSSGGFLSIGPIAMNNPTSSTLNFPVNDDRANAVTVALSGTGTLSITYAAPTLGPTAHVIFDVTGYFVLDTTGATYHALTPARILDSRDGTGGLSGPFGSHIARSFTVAGRGGVPSNATAVAGNLTVTGQTSLGYLFIGPIAMNNPTASTLNFPLNDDRANAVVVALNGGALSVTYAAPTFGPTAHVIFDVTGYFTGDMSGAVFVPLTPTRILDSRDGTGGLSGAFGSHLARTFGATGHGGVPSNATAVSGNLTVTGQNSGGFLAIGPVAVNNPTSSTLNFPLNDDRANAVIVALGVGGTLSITYAAPTLGPTAHVIFDVTGYFAP